MAFLQESDLLARARSQTSNFSNLREVKVAGLTTNVFLSHSHEDKDAVKGFISLLASQGVYVYVDWNDSAMPRITNKETADRIIGKIKELDLFLFLATAKGLASRWCPWELGIADQAKGRNKILVIPVVNKDGSFTGNEYLQIYPHLSNANIISGPLTASFYPVNESKTAMDASLQAALRRRTAQ